MLSSTFTLLNQFILHSNTLGAGVRVCDAVKGTEVKGSRVARFSLETLSLGINDHQRTTMRSTFSPFLKLSNINCVRQCKENMTKVSYMHIYKCHNVM